MKKAKMKDLTRRFLVSSIVVTIVVILITFSQSPAVSILTALFAATLASIAVWEFVQMLRVKGLEPSLYAMIGISFVIVVSFVLSFRFGIWKQLPLALLFLGALLLFSLRFKDISQSLKHIAAEFFTICYIALPVGLILAILYPSYGGRDLGDGRWWFFYFVLVTKMSDVAAYFIGSLWGRRSLAPSVSPKKTVEGSVAGLICATGISIAFYFFIAWYAPGGIPLTFFQSIWLGILIAFLSQFGDLAESSFKRDALIKDSNVLPGVGGILDMLDSLLFTAPLLYFVLNLQ